MNKKKIAIISLSSIVALLILVAVGYKTYDWYIWRAPSYNSTKKEVLLSPNVDKLSDQQEEAFYAYVHGALEDELNVSMESLDDYSLYVEKTNKKHVYYVEYTCRAVLYGIIFKYNTKLNIETKPSLKNDYFGYSNFESDLAKLGSW
ncbi:hypothetical protein SN4111_08350 [Ligilactobacillus agilis]|uniref:hypothetical protein n=1 Tax=Ligilactobacillus agilis TaxID=1601 RepID=UPI001438076E|nr:hypothetical protein [Ligilactobacillus agilis]GET14573.1 hypothetical protein SN4111_08350 [Ligilactobacillus agilis]